MDDDKTTLGQCPKGFYCPTGSENPTPCPTGTYGNSWRVTRVEDCLPCGGGTYCPDLNMTENGPDCWAGYYCSGGSPVPDPVGQAYGDECPTGKSSSQVMPHLISGILTVLFLPQVIIVLPSPLLQLLVQLGSTRMKPDKPVAIHVQKVSTVPSTLPSLSPAPQGTTVWLELHLPM